MRRGHRRAPGCRVRREGRNSSRATFRSDERHPCSRDTFEHRRYHSRRLLANDDALSLPLPRAVVRRDGAVQRVQALTKGAADAATTSRSECPGILHRVPSRLHRKGLSTDFDQSSGAMCGRKTRSAEALRCAPCTPRDACQLPRARQPACSTGLHGQNHLYCPRVTKRGGLVCVPHSSTSLTCHPRLLQVGSCSINGGTDDIRPGIRQSPASGTMMTGPPTRTRRPWMTIPPC
ncbi:hypothetical protein LZ30DRAFT_198421 [Colletotrichum cereale]|nr:hypothetical protein LZ30DRAFT_198421 [Colletotrichum cereale]